MHFSHQLVVVISLEAKEIGEHEDRLSHLLHITHTQPVECVADGKI